MTPGLHDPEPKPFLVPPPEHRWYDVLFSVSLAIFCFLLGLVLVVFPWTDAWPSNYFVHRWPWLRGLWNNAYFRGAFSGLGVINIYISFLEVFRLRRFAVTEDDGPKDGSLLQ